MTLTAVVIAPGRGTYNKADLGYLRRHHPDLPWLAEFDAYRQAQGQETLTELDRAARFSAATHTRGDTASALIYACALADFEALDRTRFRILGVTGNSMGWYIALACSGALDRMAGLRVVNTMGTLMQEQMIGGQLIYPVTDDDWHERPGERARVMAEVAAINARVDHVLALSIDLGGMLVLAGNDAGLAAFEASAPPRQDRYPMRLPNHAGFHTALQEPVSQMGFRALPETLFRQPDLAMIDGRGAVWAPGSTDTSALYRYTLGHQVTKPYDFATALRVAARDWMPDVFIILGPGTTLGGASAQALVQCNWRRWQAKSDAREVIDQTPRVLTMGDPTHRALCV